MIRKSLFSTACASLAGLAVLAGCAASTQPASTQAENHGWIKDEVADSYVYGYPLVLMAMAHNAAVGNGDAQPGQAPANTLRHAQAQPAAGAANPSTPDVDTLASNGWLDLSAEPVVVTLPDARGRYLGARALDMWSNVIWSSAGGANPRAGSAKAQTIAFVAPGWDGTLPKNVQRVDASSVNVWLSVRIQSNGPRDLTAVKKLQRAIRAVPLSVYTGDERGSSMATRGGPADTAPAAAPAARVAALDANGFFNELADALKDNPQSPADPHALKMLADLGVKPGQPVKLPGGAADAIAAGLADGRARIATAPANALTANGWSWLGDDVGRYGNDYALRAYAAYAQPGSGTKDDEVRPTVTVDSGGQQLNGANRYVIHFAAKALPPVRAFWAITAYTPDGALPDTGEARRSIGSRDRLRRNRDGSIDIYVSANSPGKARAENWLPAPDGDFKLVMRLYEPKPEATDGSWQPATVERQ
ncbi:DUF1254 domain-containing protein [Trinickia terrae]|uniref:DUF1254 domain-containing protein n=1 Tax=Trinickia terrae TaxID=2571161 RepID=A0A4U1HFY3_9BURK|nr:DUF1254 domain-containing protein [Trinickia terrae]TKC79912.1 DUF1254 domain-containing protein [Trinickia terrae]